jgi:transcriptional regulator with XRE-family HTH domain
MKETLGGRIERLIRENNLSQKDFAKDVGTTESAICRYLKDERMPRIDILSNMATALGVSLDYLVTGKESKENMSFKILTRNIENLSIEKQKQIVTIIIKQLGGE